MDRWELRFIVFKRDGEFEAECIDAAAAGVGKSLFEAVDDLVAMLNTMAGFAANNGASLTADATPDDEELFVRLTGGASDPSVAAFGHLTLTLESRENTNEARLQKMDLVGGAA